VGEGKLRAWVVILALFVFASSAYGQQATQSIEELQRDKLDLMLRVVELERQLSFYIERDMKAQRDQLQKKIEDQKKPEKK
jgi:hypothetical protein